MFAIHNKKSTTYLADSKIICIVTSSFPRLLHFIVIVIANVNQQHRQRQRPQQRGTSQ